MLTKSESGVYEKAGWGVEVAAEDATLEKKESSFATALFYKKLIRKTNKKSKVE